MAPPAALLDVHDDGVTWTRPAKRARLDVVEAIVPNEVEEISSLSRRHPLGVRPSGNAYLSETNLKDACGIFARLPDEILSILLEYLEAVDLLRLGATCRALHAFTRNEELWKALFTE